MSKVVVYIYYFALYLHRLKVPVLPKLINIIFVRLLFGCQISLGAELGKGTQLGYGGLGIVIHDRAVLGTNVTVGPGVVIGGTSQIYEVPVIGDNTVIAPGAKILGPVKIGKNCVIGANAVVLKDVPDNSVAVGIPAKIVKTDIDISKYR
jgi:serine O-acetyltransferase